MQGTKFFSITKIFARREVSRQNERANTQISSVQEKWNVDTIWPGSSPNHPLAVAIAVVVVIVVVDPIRLLSAR